MSDTVVSGTPALPARPPGRRRGIALLLLVIAVIAGSIAASELTSARELEARSPVPVAAATSGSVFCPVTALDGRTAALTLGALTEVDAEVTITRYGPTGPVKEQPQLLAAGTRVTQQLEGDLATQPVVIEWRGGPVGAQMRLQTADESLAANCVSDPSPTWHLAGFDTTLRAESLLHLFNPFPQDATVSLAFGTEQGAVQLVRTDEINVPANQTVVLDLADFQADTLDLAVTVTTEAGRVIPQGEVLVQPPGEDLEGVRGRDLIPAAPAATALALIPSARVDATTQSWLTVYNPTRRAAAVQVGVSTPLGDASTLATETTIPAGGTTRIALDGVSALPDFGVRVSSVNGVGVVVTRTDAVIDGDRHTITTALGVPATADQWVLLGATPAPDAPSGATVTIFNPTPEVLQAQVTADGQTVATVELSPNKLELVPLDAEQLTGPLVVTADGSVVAGLLAEDDAGAWTVTGIAPGQILGGGEALRAQRDPGLSSVPAISATATPTPDVVIPDAAGEGGLGGEEVVPTESFAPVAPIIATPTDLPTELPSDPPPPTPAPEPAPTPSETPAQTPSASPSASEVPTAEEEGDLIG